MIIDEETASIVKLIFKYALNGLIGSDIARKLNGLEIFTPAGYSNTNRQRKYVVDDKTVWTSPKVLKIIRTKGMLAI
ncbi:Recombinase [[Clostridium] fimetarium]|uniref:Recombinase n=1 Tax=[Clostridium] fimetarium TaxID=99656 RepID=A0A1I0RP31_9FIRM|nr:Recombinase [[Clostridium] fimetarium]